MPGKQDKRCSIWKPNSWVFKCLETWAWDRKCSTQTCSSSICQEGKWLPYEFRWVNHHTTVNLDAKEVLPSYRSIVDMPHTTDVADRFGILTAPIITSSRVCLLTILTMLACQLRYTGYYPFCWATKEDHNILWGRHTVRELVILTIGWYLPYASYMCCRHTSSFKF